MSELYGRGPLMDALPGLKSMRMSPRGKWKAAWRQVRILRRETSKAQRDMLIFGTGYVFVSGDGFINHVLPDAVLIGSDGSITRKGAL